VNGVEQLAEVIRIEGARLLATLVRTIGDLSIAEEAVQEAAIAALAEWPRSGVPDHPRAWLTTTARRKAIDIIRRERARTGKEQAGVHLMELSRADDPPDTVLRDDLLRLIFTCCHPALAPESRVALALRTLCQLSTAQVAAVMLTSEAAAAKRLTRTRQKIATARIPYRVPADAELPDRLPAVCGVVHALYTSGHAPVGGNALLDIDVCLEGLRLARLLHELLPDEPMPAAVLALILLTEARRPARSDAADEVVLLADQDRALWDRVMIGEGLQLLDESLRRTQAIADPYQLQAAIAAEHARASSYGATDWAEIVRLYDLLLAVAPSGPAALSRAVAVAERNGAEAGLAALRGLEPEPRLEAVRSELLARMGRYAEAVVAVDASLVGDVTEPERRYRERKRSEWTQLAAAAAGQAVADSFDDHGGSGALLV
jgi:RNA polymerase sigma factor (sigma-70 family)